MALGDNGRSIRRNLSGVVRPPGCEGDLKLVNYISAVKKCEYASFGGCGGKLQNDHIVPVARGGNDRPENYQWVCATHNVDKGSLTHEEYLAKLEHEGAPGSRGPRRSSRGRRRPWVNLVAGGRPFKKDDFVALVGGRIQARSDRDEKCPPH